ncbi:hypothetical protein AB0H34_23360, partial [Saccharopolyspora shandongensis]|uniref:hypothetical protein n=1 Tax=Saccharopolyspora shandongensis TaxID=418495 RepID=UPI0033C95D17
MGADHPPVQLLWTSDRTRSSPVDNIRNFNEVISVDFVVFVVGEGECGADDRGDFAWAGGD